MGSKNNNNSGNKKTVQIKDVDETLNENNENDDEKIESNTKKEPQQLRIYRNPFLNFLRDFRRMNSNLSFTQISCQGAIKWNKMTTKEKLKYRRPSPYCYRMKRTNRSRSRSRSGSSSENKSRSRHRSRRPRRKSKTRSKSRSKSKSKASKKT